MGLGFSSAADMAKQRTAEPQNIE